MKFYMHQQIIGENLIKIGLILSAQWRFSEERYQACPVTLRYVNSETVVKRDPHPTALPPNTLNHHLSVQACPFHQAKRCHMSYSRTSQYI